VAIRDLEDMQKLADKLTPAQQLQLAEYLIAKARPSTVSEEALLSESLLAKDWLRPEEDLAWANL
jgi:hypothetical protein